MVKKKQEKIILEKVLKNFEIYCESFYANMYNCYAYGTGYNISKYKEKTEYRLNSNIKKIEKVLETENVEQIKQEFLKIYSKLEKKKKELLQKKDWVQAFSIVYSCILQQSYIKEITEQLFKGKLDKEMIIKNVLSSLSDFKWDFERILDRNFPNAEFIYLEKATTRKQKKWKKLKKF